MPVRSLFGVARSNLSSPGYYVILTRMYYPALTHPTPEPGIPFPADPSGAPYPVVIFMNGANCPMDLYRWLAIRLVLHGLLVMTYDWVQPAGRPPLPNLLAVSPVLDPRALPPHLNSSDGGRGVPFSTALPALFKEIDGLNSKGVLRSLIDSHTIIVGGHSFGGLVALDSGTWNYFPRVKAVFSYGAHTMGPSSLGIPAGSFLPLPTKLPYLIMGGSRDGIVSAGANWTHPYTPVVLTWQEALPGGQDNQYLLVFEGANHFVITFPQDNTTSGGYLDLASASPPAVIRDYMSAAIGIFVSAEVRKNATAQRVLSKWIESPPAYTLQLSRK